MSLPAITHYFTVPHGLEAGQQVEITVDGRLHRVTIPEGVIAGMMVRVRLDASAAAASAASPTQDMPDVSESPRGSLGKRASVNSGGGTSPAVLTPNPGDYQQAASRQRGDGDERHRRAGALCLDFQHAADEGGDVRSALEQRASQRQARRGTPKGTPNRRGRPKRARAGGRSSRRFGW